MCTAGAERSQGVTEEKGVPRTTASKWAGQSQGGWSQGNRGSQVTEIHPVSVC